MIYRALGLMSGSSLDGLDIVFAELNEERGQWNYEILAADCFEYSSEWKTRLQEATTLNALDYQLLHTDYGHYLGQEVNRFIELNHLHYQVGLVASHGHTSFHMPQRKMTAQLGDGAAIAAETGLPVISDLRALDIAFGGQGAPIVPIGEKLLWKDYPMFLNLGGIANISFSGGEERIAFDVCPANRVLNLLAALENQLFDDEGKMAASGAVHQALLDQLDQQEYYQRAAPKSLPNSFGTDEIFPIIQSHHLPVADALRTFVEHIVGQLKSAVSLYHFPGVPEKKMLVTGGGAFNSFLIQRLGEELRMLNVELVVPDEKLVKYKEALVMALIGVLRWRQENNVLSSVTGASRDSIGGAVWIGQEA